ncbi:MAG: cation-transporting P-type ATPase [Candidatus Korarchaeota archaeon]|nr:cation-transporting P-type ATPase [Candidatus Korarchaeota archaeon]NIU83764.1 HAD-IC family P-type ATPase [Candidatus Thorarchaeota archaeon]NIW15349.1 HAD-IC family P-type ATPase [Candidatus Thorarchaeota archaeon]NIW52075.1 HAD-IC family P-type ATPase [Candidatus Korarchaeota archaeon]
MSYEEPPLKELMEKSQIFSTPYTFPPEKALTKLRSSEETGLSSSDATSRITLFGKNEIPKVKTSIWKVYIAPISNWLINIYLIAAFIIFFLSITIPPEFTSVITGETIKRSEFYLTVIPWFVVIGANSLVAIIQQFRGQKKLEALQELISDRTTVVRDGERTSLTTTEVVPGDILILTQGDKVPADCLILESHDLILNEAPLTGESTSVKKKVSKEGLKEIVPIQERSNMVYMGTFVTKGSAKCVVVNTGLNSIMGSLSKELESVTTGDIPIRRKVNVLAKYLGMGVLILLFLSISVRIWTLFREASSIVWADLVNVTIQGIILAFTIMPINIVLLVTVVLLTGVLAMARSKVVVRDLSAVESLGRVSVICSDKTGTITENKMTVKRAWDGTDLYTVTGTGYSKEGKIFQIHEKSPPPPLQTAELEVHRNELSRPLQLILLNCFLNNDAKIQDGTILGDPTDGACKVFFYKDTLEEEDIKRKYDVVAEFPFDSELKRMAKAFKSDHSNIVFVKGATEILLDRCTEIFQRNEIVKLTQEHKKEVLDRVNDFAAQGFRVISFSYKVMDEYPENIEEKRDRIESELIYCGFVCILDPPRPGVYEAIRDCQSAGIDVLMITGDSLETAKSIASELDILEEEKNHLVVKGEAIPKLTDEAFLRTRVFARVAPKDKQKIVKRYQDQGKVVAMTGDGVNDALAVSMSDCGIAMGVQGTDVTKQASDIIITDDSFTSIETGVEEGRNLVKKIRMLCYFYVCINLMEAIVLFGLFFLFGVNDPTFTPLLNYQLQWLTVTSHTFPGFALILDKNTPQVMQEKPRNTEEIIDRSLFKMITVHAILMAVSVLIIYLLTLYEIYPLFPGNEAVISEHNLALQKARTMAICVIILSEAMVVISIRRINLSIIEANKGKEFMPRVYFLIGLIILGTVGLIYIPQVQRAVLAATNGAMRFDFMWLTLIDWIVILLAVLPSIIGVELYKWFKRQQHVFF